MVHGGTRPERLDSLVAEAVTLLARLWDRLLLHRRRRSAPVARREIFVDDYDGTEDDSVETRRFSIGRKALTIDLTASNYEKFLKHVAEWVDKATPEEPPARSVRSPEPRKNTRGTQTKGEPSRAAQVREWAKGEGIEVSPRGRIHKDVLEKYEYAMESEAKGDPKS